MVHNGKTACTLEKGYYQYGCTMYNKQAVWCPSHCLAYLVSIRKTEIINNLRISRQSHTTHFHSLDISLRTTRLTAEQQTTNDNLFRIPTSSQITPLRRSNSTDKYCYRSQGRYRFITAHKQQEKKASLSNCFSFQRPKHIALILTTANLQCKVHCALRKPHFISLPKYGWSR